MNLISDLDALIVKSLGELIIHLLHPFFQTTQRRLHLLLRLPHDPHVLLQNVSPVRRHLQPPFQQVFCLLIRRVLEKDEKLGLEEGPVTMVAALAPEHVLFSDLDA